MTWLYQGTELEEVPAGMIGFVYEITNLIDDRRYIGKKNFFFSKSKVVKGKKKRSKVESDWKTYYGSNEELKKDVEKHGAENFRREVLHLCKNKGTMGYLELREQIDRRVLENRDTYYNRWIMARINASHIDI